VKYLCCSCNFRCSSRVDFLILHVILASILSNVLTTDDNYSSYFFGYDPSSYYYTSPFNCPGYCELCPNSGKRLVNCLVFDLDDPTSPQQIYEPGSAEARKFCGSMPMPSSTCVPKGEWACMDRATGYATSCSSDSACGVWSESLIDLQNIGYLADADVVSDSLIRSTNLSNMRIKFNVNNGDFPIDVKILPVLDSTVFIQGYAYEINKDVDLPVTLGRDANEVFIATVVNSFCAVCFSMCMI
jgi:hypothetical protein